MIVTWFFLIIGMLILYISGMAYVYHFIGSRVDERKVMDSRSIKQYRRWNYWTGVVGYIWFIIIPLALLSKIIYPPLFSAIYRSIIPYQKKP